MGRSVPHAGILLLIVAGLSSACGDDANPTPDAIDAVIDAGDAGDAAADLDANDRSVDVVDETPAPPIPEGCNPIAWEWDCFFPYPSDVFLVDDALLPSGRRVQIPEAALPHDEAGVSIDLLATATLDGASVFPQIEVWLPISVDGAGMPGPLDAASALPGSSDLTVIVDADSGALVPHFAEVDSRPPADHPQMLALRPLAPLEPSTRYVVAIRGLTREVDGEALAPPETFLALRDGRSPLAELEAHYEESVFAVLEAAEVPREDLQLAWDFTTGSDKLRTGPLLSIRDQIDGLMSEAPPSVEITHVESDPEPHIARYIEGTVAMPLFVDSEQPGARLVRDDAGLPVVSGAVDVPFVAYVPNSVVDRLDSDGPARMLQFGHGFFGSFREAGGFPARLAAEHRFVLIAVEWWGMSENDRPLVIEAITGGTERTANFVERTHQGIANALGLGYAARDVFHTLEPFQLAGDPLYDNDALYFLGISQGHILGGVFAALSPLVERSAFSVGGAGFGLIMTRSTAFGLFKVFLDIALATPLDSERLLSILVPILDPIDPATWSSRLAASPDRHQLLHLGLGDVSVPTFGGHVHARALGIPLLSPAPRELPGLSSVTAPHDGSALVEFDFGIDPDPTLEWGIPGGNTAAHEGVRRLPAAMRQIDLFLREGGRVEATCDGVCDPE